MTKLPNSTPANRDSVERLPWFALEEQSKWNSWAFEDDTAMLERAQATSDGNSVNGLDQIYVPITYAYKLLPSNVSLRLELTQSRSEFSIIAAKPKVDELKYADSGNTPDIKVHTDKLVWHVCEVRPYDHTRDSNNQRLLRNGNLFLPTSQAPGAHHAWQHTFVPSTHLFGPQTAQHYNCLGRR